MVELVVFFPPNAHFKGEAFQAFLSSLPALTEPLSFEVFGNRSRVVMLFTTSRTELGRVKPLLAAHFPTATFQELPAQLETVWTGSEEKAVLEFGLGREFMLPLATGIPDVLVSLTGALQGLSEDEVGVYQILFQPMHHRWEASIQRAVTHSDGRPFFANAPELVTASERKVSRRLFSVVVRLAAGGEDIHQAWAILTGLAGSLRLFQNPQGNELIPLSNEAYPYADHLEDVVCRQSRRCGMLLNVEELTGFAHLPTVPLPVFSATLQPTNAAPNLQPAAGSLVLGVNEHLGQTVSVVLTQEQRFRHLHLIGATGTGKSTLLFNLIRQDIEQGQGVAVLDPHGDLIDRVLGVIPDYRQEDVIVFDPSDPEFTVGFNLLSAHSEAEKALLASDLVSVFERHSTSWGDQMNSVLRNAVMAFLESSRGGTLLDLRRFLLEPDFRAEFLSTVEDTEVLYYWQKAFPQLSGTKSLGPILTRLDTFLSPKPIRHALTLQEARLDFARVMDSGKIFLAKLPQGLIGRENSFLLGSLLVGKFQQLAMARQSLPEHQRRPFHLVIDEFHQFMTPSMAEILNGARKYRVGLTLAHQELRQLATDKEVESALLANAGTRVVFRVGDADAKHLSEGFAHFETADISKLEKGQAICRIERSDHDFNLRVTPSVYPSEQEATASRESVIARSREQFATPRTEIETLLRHQLTITHKPEKPKPAKPASTPLPVEPKVAEPVPVTEVPQAKESPPEPKPAITLEPPAPPKENITVSEEKKTVMGRGGIQHKAIQQRLKSGAEELGFRAIIEKEVLNGAGSIDLVLEKESIRYACEITITTTIDQEVGNALKCIRAGFDRVAMISTSQERLQKLSAAISNSLGPEVFARVSFYLPDDFLNHLRELELQPKSTSVATIPPDGTFKVKRNLVRLGPQELKAREAEAIKLIAESMKRKK